MGTVDYVAPEQIRGDDVDGRADQYALGCLLFECLTGSLPFRHRSEVATIFAHLEEPRPGRERAPRRAAAPRWIPCSPARWPRSPRERFDSCRALVAATHDALGLVARRRRGAARWLVPVLALAVVALAIAAVALGLDRGAPAAAAGPHGTLTLIDPRTNGVRGTTERAGLPPGGDDDRRRHLDRRLPRGRPVALRPRDEDPAADLVQRRAARHRRARRRGLRRGRRQQRSRARSRATTPRRASAATASNCSRAPLASGDGVVWAAGCPFVDRLSTDGQRLRRLRHIFLPFQPAGDRVDDARPVPRARSRRRLAVGARRRARSPRRGDWTLARGTVQATIALRFPPRSVVVADGAAWITDGLHDTVVPVDARSNRVLPAIAGRPRGRRRRRRRPGAVWVANAIDGTVSRVDARSHRVIATVEVGGSPERDRRRAERSVGDVA